MQRGIALILTLIVAALLGMLSVALIGLNRDSLSLMATSIERQNAYEGCRSALDYVRSRLTSDITFGTAALAGPTTTLSIPGKLTVTESGATLAANQIDGQMGGASTFTAQLVNNLSGAGPVPAPAFSRRASPVPPRSALVVVTARSGRATRRLEALLKRDYFTDGSLSSANDLAITISGAPGSALSFSSDDPARNGVHSNGNVLLPLGTSMSFGATPGSGKVSGQTDINVGGTATVNAQGQITGISSGTWLSGNAAVKTSTEASSNSTMTPGQSSNTPNLSASDLKTPTGGTHPLPGGQYVFTGPGQVAYFNSMSANPATDPPTQIYTNTIYDSGATSGAPGTEAIYLNGNRFIPVGRVQASSAVQVDALNGIQAQLSMGYDSAGNLDPLAPQDSSLEVQGDLTVKGDAVGYGSVITHAPTAGEGVLTVNGKSQLSAAPDQAIALFAEGPIKLEPVTPQATTAPDAFLSVDFEVLGQASTAWGCWTSLNGLSSLNNAGRAGLMGVNDAGMGGPLTRDSPLANYDTAIASRIPGWPATTPGGNPMPPEAVAYVTNCLAAPNPGAFPWNNDAGISIGRHLRLEEFLKSVDAGTPDLTWLDLRDNTKNSLVTTKMVNLYTRFNDEAVAKGLPSLQAYLTGPNPYLNTDYRDIQFKGLVYTAAHMLATAARNFDVDGAVAAAGGSLAITGIEKGNFHFNSAYLDSLMSNSNTRLETVLFMLD